MARRVLRRARSQLQTQIEQSKQRITSDTDRISPSLVLAGSRTLQRGLPTRKVGLEELRLKGSWKETSLAMPKVEQSKDIVLRTALMITMLVVEEPNLGGY